MPIDQSARETRSSVQQPVQQPVQQAPRDIEEICAQYDVVSGARGHTMLADEGHPDVVIPYVLRREVERGDDIGSIDPRGLVT